MKYITFLSRDIWPAFNSIYAYTKIKGHFPKKIVLLYSQGDMVGDIEKRIRILYQVNGKEVTLIKRKIGEEITTLRKILLDIVEEGDVIDITGARKATILALMGVENVKITYLMLRDMSFSSYPFMMRPVSLQRLMEVSQ